MLRPDGDKIEDMDEHESISRPLVTPRQSTYCLDLEQTARCTELLSPVDRFRRDILHTIPCESTCRRNQGVSLVVYRPASNTETSSPPTLN